MSRTAAGQARAALRNALLRLLRSRGWTNIADALRHYAASAANAIRLLTPTPPNFDFDTALGKGLGGKG